MSASVLNISPAVARRFLLRRFALSACSSAGSVDEVVSRLGYVQMDSIPMLHRMHDLIFLARLPAYQPDDLSQYLYLRRAGLEYYLPNLAIFSREQLPLLQHAMLHYEQRWGGVFRLQGSLEQRLAEELVAFIRAQGPTHPKQFRHGHTTTNPWGSRSRTSTFVLEKLMMMGVLGVAQRTRFERHYELFERLFPEVLALRTPPKVLPCGPLRAHAAALFKPAALLREGLDPNALMPVHIEGSSKRYAILRSEQSALAEAEAIFQPGPLQFLAPLDPLIYDRERTRALFGFDYTWEVYVPPAKRKWGYYVLPILLGETLVGRLEARPQRSRQTLEVLSLTLEPGIALDWVVPPLAVGLLRLRDWVGMSGIEAGRLEPTSLWDALREAGCPLERRVQLD